MMMMMMILYIFSFLTKPVRPLISSSVPSADVTSPAPVHEPVMQWATPPLRSAQSTSDGVVAWFGPLSFRSSTLCDVELVSGVAPDYRLTQMLVFIPPPRGLCFCFSFNRITQRVVSEL